MKKHITYIIVCYNFLVKAIYNNKLKTKNSIIYPSVIYDEVNYEYEYKLNHPV